MVSRHYLSEGQHTCIVNESISDMDESNGSFSKQYDIPNISNTDNVSETELTECLPFTSRERFCSF
ncbi:hypothetical protein X975_03697, partial [Stegodyphus mimosarum]